MLKATLKAYLRPTHDRTTGRLVAIAVCTTNGTVLVDEQILAHFDAHASGKEIRESYGYLLLVWGKPLYTTAPEES